MEAEMAERKCEPGVLTGVSEGAVYVKGVLADTFEGGLDNAKRALKRGRRSTEDALDSVAYKIKRRPLETTGVTFAVGLVCGAMVGYLFRRNGK